MSYLKHKTNNVRYLLGLTLAAAMLTSLVAITTYSASRSRASDVAKTNRGTSPLTQPQTPALKANGKIAFVSDRDGNEEIYVMDADGSNQTRLTNNPADDGSPAWSPDGARIVFTSDRDGNLEIYAMNADGSDQTRLTNNSVGDFQPDWSPDGTKIVFVRVFVRGALDINGLFVMNADGSEQRKIIEGFFSSPVWSPDGTKFAVACEGNDGFSEDICVMNASGSELRRLTQAEFLEFNYAPAWSPDGAKILFAQGGFCLFEPSCTDTLFVFDADGNDRQQVLSGGTIGNPGWSPDGTRITFDSAQSSSSNPDIFVADISGTGVTNLSRHPARDFDPAWQPLPVVAPILNPLDEAQFFVRQQYLDFLGREPDSIGFQNWVNTLTGCPNGGFGEFDNPDCDRVHVSAGFYLSDEFRGRGYWAYRFYQTSLGRAPLFAEFLPDMLKVGGPQSPQQEVVNKQTFTDEWVNRAEFKAKYDALTNPMDYVNELLSTTGVNLSNRDALVNSLQNQQMTRAQVLREIVESKDVEDKFFIQAFVSMQYFGYLRRDPDTIGYNNWVTTLTNDPGNYRHMIFGFIYSTEYRQRFGP